MPARKKRPQGFTLVEVIVIIIVAGFLGALVVNLMGTQLLRSATPVTSAQDAAQAEGIMEQVVAYYSDNVNNNTSGTLTAVYNKYHSATNATITLTRNATNTFDSDGLDSLTVLVTVGDVAFSTLLTQQRTNATDDKVSF
jgi:hypothetical protein